jgi:hypothetical protein
MATKVTQKYGSSYNTSVTKRDGRITKFTVWLTGVPGSTFRVDFPKK